MSPGVRIAQQLNILCILFWCKGIWDFLFFLYFVDAKGTGMDYLFENYTRLEIRIAKLTRFSLQQKRNL